MTNGRTIDFFNLTRGLLCEHHQNHPNPHYLRIQSTLLEQTQFSRVLETVGPDLLYHLAVGSRTCVHDVSERPRVTRALWQGMTWISFACERLWGLSYEEATPPIMRNGHNTAAYFDRILQVDVPEQVKKQVRYFEQFWHGERISYDICAGQNHPSTTHH